MNRRNAVISALAGVAALVPRVLGGADPTVGYSLKLQKGPTKDGILKGCRPDFSARHIGDTVVMTCDYEGVPEPDYALEVSYGDRVVRITAKEIMDALEGKEG